MWKTGIKKIHFIVKSIIFCTCIMFSVNSHAFVSPNAIYQLAHDGNTKELTRLTNVIDTIDNDDTTALCKAVYQHDYSAFHILRTMGANPYQRCILRLSDDEMFSFNAGYKSWFYQVKQGRVKPNWATHETSSSWLSSFKGYALEIGIAGIAVGAVAATGGGGGGGSSSHDQTETAKEIVTDCSGHGIKNPEGICSCNEGYEGELCESIKSCGDGYVLGSTCNSGYVQEGKLCKSGDTSYIKCVEADCLGYTLSCSTGYHVKTGDTCQSGARTLRKCEENDCSDYPLSVCDETYMTCTSCTNATGTKYKKGSCKEGWKGDTCTEPQECAGDYQASCEAGYHQNTSASCKSGNQMLYKCVPNDCSAYSEECGDGYNTVEACLSGTKQYYSCVPKICGDGYIPGTTCPSGYVQEGVLCESGDASYIKCVEAPCTGYTESCTTAYHEKAGDTCQSGKRTLVKCEENDCSAFPFTTCDETYMTCTSCTNTTGTKYQKSSCNEGWEGNDCTSPATCSGYSHSCENGYQVVSGDTCKSGTEILVKCTENSCEGFTVGVCPTNAEDCTTCLRGTTNTYKFTQCKDGWEGETCSEEKACSGYPLTSCPDSAECKETCRSGNTDKFKITGCTNTDYVPSSDGGSCVIHCEAGKYASGDTCSNCPPGATSPENSPSIDFCDCGSGYKLEGGICQKVDFSNIDQHPGSTKTAEEFASETEFRKGNFLGQINAQYAYELGYNGYLANKDLTTGDLVSSDLTNTKIKVGVLDTGVDITHPDLVNNIVKDGSGKPYGYNFDYGLCRNGDTSYCYGIKSNDGTSDGSIVFYKEDADHYDVILPGSFSYSYLSSFFQNYPTGYDWDKVQNDPSPHDTKDNTSTDQTNTNDADHGTHIAGIIAASVNNAGLQGVAPNAEIVASVHSNSPLTVGGNLVNSYLTQTYQAFADEGVRVVNKSWGSEATADTSTWASYAIGKDASKVDYHMIDAYKIAAQNNIVSVVAAGNEGNTIQASLDNGIPLTTTFGQGSDFDLTNLFITVVAADKNDKLASYSQVCGATNKYCLTAPGGDMNRGSYTVYTEYKSRLDDLNQMYSDNPTAENLTAYLSTYGEYLSARDAVPENWGIYSTVQNDSRHSLIKDGGASYGYMQGTSMAAPVVTGSVALLMSAYPYLRSQDIVEILFRSANKNLEGWGSTLYNEVKDITVSDSLSTWTDSFGNKYDISSIYGHGEVDLKAATKPLGEVKIPVKGTKNKQSIVNTKLAIPLLLNSNLSNSVPNSIMGLDDYNRPFSQSISGLVYRAKRNSDNFKRDFKSFVQPKKISTAGVQDKLSFEFSSSQTDKSLLGMGSLDMMYNFNDSNKMKFSYRSDVLAEKSLSEKVISNPFMDMTDSYALGHEFKMNSKLGFGFSAMTGKNGFYETDEDKDDEFKKSVQAFDMSAVYKPVSQVSLKAVGGLLKENDSVLGMNGSGLFETENSTTYYTGAILEYMPSMPFTLSAAYYYGQSKMPTTSGLVQFDNIISDSFAFEAKYQPNEDNVFGLQFISPLRIKKGSAVFNLPVARDLYSDDIYYDKTKVSLKPSARELDFGMYYLSQSDTLDWRTELMMRLHPDHVSGVKPDYRALFGLSYDY